MSPGVFVFVAAETEAVNWQEKVSFSPELPTSVLMLGSDGVESCSLWMLRSMPGLLESPEFRKSGLKKLLS